jgi:ubiquinone/menaquinone biosynthesis C-methylase UbiE
MTRGKVYGVDISPGMIDYAKNVESSDDITYIVSDCSNPIPIEIKFDVAAATFLL